MIEQALSMLELARRESGEERRRLLEHMADFLLAPDGRLSERERALMGDIIGKLIGDMEVEIRRGLAERLGALGRAPRDLILKLAEDEPVVARPILLRSPVLHDEDLIRLVKQRSDEHRLAIAMRSGIGPAVSQALIEHGSEDVVETLVRNKDAELSRQAIDYLVEESRRVDRFQEPLLRRQDLPRDLAMRMFWWVSAALRRDLLGKLQIEEAELDDLIASTVHASIAERPPSPSEAEKLVARMALRGELTPRSLVQMLRLGRVSAFVAGLARLAGVDYRTGRRIVLSPIGEALAALCRAAEIDRTVFSSLFLLLREGREHGPLATDQFQAMLVLYDQMTAERARVALRFWMRDADYLDAIAAVDRIAPAVAAG